MAQTRKILQDWCFVLLLPVEFFFILLIFILQNGSDPKNEIVAAFYANRLILWMLLIPVWSGSQHNFDLVGENCRIGLIFQ